MQHAPYMAAGKRDNVIFVNRSVSVSFEAQLIGLFSCRNQNSIQMFPDKYTLIECFFTAVGHLLTLADIFYLSRGTPSPLFFLFPWNDKFQKGHALRLEPVTEKSEVQHLNQ